MSTTTSKKYEVTIRVGVYADGAWGSLNDDEKITIETLEHDSDRGTSSTLATMLDSRLKWAICSRLKRHKKIEVDLFDPTRPLSSLNAKIDMAAMLGIISTDAHHDLHLFRGVRNRFAHHLDIRSFNDPWVLDKLTTLKLINTHIVEFTQGPGSFVWGLAPASKPMISVSDIAGKRKQGKQRFLLTAQVILAALTMADLHTHLDTNLI
jgi:hypothetical protein